MCSQLSRDWQVTVDTIAGMAMVAKHPAGKHSCGDEDIVKHALMGTNYHREKEA